MRQARAPGIAHPTSSSPQWVKVAFALVIFVFLAVGVLLLEQLDDANRDFSSKLREKQEKAEANEKLKRENENTVEFLTKYNNDAEFREREARQRLGYTAPGEIVFRLDPPPKSESPQPK